MGVRLVGERGDGTIPVRELRDGQIGEITKWGSLGEQVGRIVQRYGPHDLISLGMHKGCGWDNFPHLTEDNLRVRPFPDGTRLEVHDNE